MKLETKNGVVLEGFRVGGGSTIEEVVRHGNNRMQWVDDLIAKGLLELSGNEIVDVYIHFNNNAGEMCVALPGDYIIKVPYPLHDDQTFNLVVVDSHFADVVFNFS